MYRVMLTPGDERHFETKQEFQDACARGLIGRGALVHMGGAWGLAKNHPDYVPLDPTLPPLPAPPPPPKVQAAPPPARSPSPTLRGPEGSLLSAHPILSDDGVPLLEPTRGFDLPTVEPMRPVEPAPMPVFTADAELEAELARPDERSEHAEQMLGRMRVLRQVRSTGWRLAGWAVAAALVTGIGYAGWRYIPELWSDARHLAGSSKPRAVSADTLTDSLALALADSLAADKPGVSPNDSAVAAPVATASSDSAAAPSSPTAAPPVSPAAPAPAPAPAPKPGSLARDPSRPPDPLRPSTLIYHFEVAMDSLRSGLHEELSNVGFAGVLRPGRLGTLRHLRNGRQSVAAARNIIRLYRRDTRLLEQTFRDTLTGFHPEQLSGAAARQWEERRVRPEPYLVTTVADSMMATVDSIMGFLAERPGRYRVRSTGALSFDEFEDATRYEKFYVRIRYLLTLGQANAAEGSPPVTVLETARALVSSPSD